ncbi:DUF6332 family protein [Streptomyces sp. NPDC007162]|uniref:DUF6332 family protein n=1 Tax=Streptomyces sp. NPDC007162 TaxID=3156917 RepID=UPI0033DC885C
MTSHGARRGQAERDAITVEIGYALFSGVLAAALAFGAVAGPALLFDLPAGVEQALRPAGTVAAALLFVARVVGVLAHFRRAGQPSEPGQPGRTRPDA